MNQLLDNSWYHIPDYNGYVINNKGIVKSMKNFNACPEGMFIKQKTDRNGEAYYELTGLKNKREKVYVSKILNSLYNADGLYVLGDNEVYMGARNRGYMNYQKKFPNDRGTMQPHIPGQPIVIPRIRKDEGPKEVKLSFPSFEKFKKPEPEPMVRFY